MVLKPSRRRARISLQLQNVLIFVVCLATSYTALRFLLGQTLTEFVQQTVLPALSRSKIPEKINLQPTIDAWVKVQKGRVGVAIYDLDHETYVAKYNSTVNFDTASLYKLSVAYEEYARVAAGELNPNQKIVENYTRLECLDLMIRQSHSPCAETLAEKDDIDFTLSASPEDLVAVLKKFYYHPDFSDEFWEIIKDSMLNQPPVDGQNWRQGLPAGFKTAAVYDKVGWAGDGSAWTTYNDAALIELENRHLIIVVMTSYTNPSALKTLGETLEATLLSS